MDQLKLSENAAALSANFHQSARAQEAYDKAGQALGGFPGLWKLCAWVAVVVTEQEEAGYLKFDDGDPDWIEFMDALGEYLVDFLIANQRQPTVDEVMVKIQQLKGGV